jgi:hypothetical protein
VTTVHALTYERRRLTGVVSTWLVVLAVLAVDAAVALLTARQPALSDDPVRVLTAGIPLLPLPIAALGAGAVGALSYGHEVRYPTLRPLLLPARRRLRLLFAKLVVVGVFSASLAAATLAVDVGVFAAVLRRSVPLPIALAGYLALVVAGGWTGLLAAGLLRSAAAGMLMLLTVPVLAEPVVSVVRSRHLVGAGLHVLRWRALFPVDSRHAWLYGAFSGLRGGVPLSPHGLVALVLGPVVLLLVGYLLVLPRRRGV